MSFEKRIQCQSKPNMCMESALHCIFLYILYLKFDVEHSRNQMRSPTSLRYEQKEQNERNAVPPHFPRAVFGPAINQSSNQPVSQSTGSLACLTWVLPHSIELLLLLLLSPIVCTQTHFLIKWNVAISAPHHTVCSTGTTIFILASTISINGHYHGMRD